MENTHSNFAKTQTKDVPKFSFIALVMAAFVFLITFLTALITTPSFLNHFATTIISWNIPLIIIAMLVYASVTEKRGSILRWIAFACMVLSFIFTNTTKNAYQDKKNITVARLEIDAAYCDDKYDEVRKAEREYEEIYREKEEKYERRNRNRDEDYDYYN